jgi:hypothetical protein
MVLIAGAALKSDVPARAAGNGGPSGPHFNLNVHGVANGQTFTASSDSHNIWAPLDGNCRINLQMGPLGVINSDCVNGNALFQLPCPGTMVGTVCEASSTLTYSIWARVVAGKGSASMFTCFTDTSGTFCNTGMLVVPLNKTTPPKFTNVSKQLLQACVPSSTAGGPGSLQEIFTGSATNPFWMYDNMGVRLAQFRIAIPDLPAGLGRSRRRELHRGRGRTVRLVNSVVVPYGG